MKIRKVLLSFVVCLIVGVTGSVTFADEIAPGSKITVTENNVTYQFDNEEVMKAFQESRTSDRSIDLYYPKTTKLVSSYTRIVSSGNRIMTVNGGRYGGTMSIGATVALNMTSDGLTVGVSIFSGASYPVPAYRNGNIIVQSRIRIKRFQMERRVGNRTINLGYYTTAYPEAAWYKPVYW